MAESSSITLSERGAGKSPHERFFLSIAREIAILLQGSDHIWRKCGHYMRPSSVAHFGSSLRVLQELDYCSRKCPRGSRGDTTNPVRPCSIISAIPPALTSNNCAGG